jgi:hypothetical protein
MAQSYIPKGYFDKDNIDFIIFKIQQQLAFDFKNTILIDRPSVIRVMQRIIEERMEDIPKMNQRVVMELVNEIRTHQIDVNKRLKWEKGYTQSQLLYDPVGLKGPDVSSIKLANRLGKPKVGGTVGFYFT